MEALLRTIEVLAMIVFMVLILLFFAGQFTNLLTPSMLAFATSSNSAFAVVGAAVVVELSKFARKRLT